MEASDFSESFSRYLLLLRRWIWLMVLCAFVAAGTTYLLSKRIVPVYQASTLVFINEAPSNKGVDLNVIQTSERLAKTYAQIMTTRPVLEGTVERLGLELNLDALERSISVQPLADTQLMVVKVENNDPERAAKIANTLVAEFSEQNRSDQVQRFSASKENMEAELARLSERILEVNTSLSNLGETPEANAQRDRLEASLAQYRQSYTSLLQSYEQLRLTEAQSISTILQKEPAYPPRSPIRPRTMRDTALAAVIGLLLGFGIAVLFEALDDTLRNGEDISHQLGIKVLGVIANYPADENCPITVRLPRHPVVEAYRSLRTNLQFAGTENPLRTIVVTSPTPEDGKSTIATNLALVLAQSGRKTFLIDADLRRPKIHKFFGLENNDGLGEMFIRPRLVLNGNLKPVETRNISVLTAGRLAPNPAELLESARMEELLAAVKEQYDVGVIDTPPVLAVTDASVLAPKVDGVLLVVRPGITKKEAAKQAIAELRHVGANVLGVVLNGVDIRHSRYYRYSKNYYY
jgi:non-specific protein-tyrosine kinase